MASRKTEVRGHVGRPMLSPEYAVFLRLRWGGWNFLVGLLCLVLPQIPAKKRHVVTSVPSSSRSQACTNVIRLREEANIT